MNQELLLSQVRYSPHKDILPGDRSTQYIDWSVPSQQILLQSEMRRLMVTTDNRRMELTITPPQLPEKLELPQSSLWLVEISRIVPHEQSNPKMIRKPVNIAEAGWAGPALSGFFIDREGKIIVPYASQQPWENGVNLLNPNTDITPVLIDGANRRATVLKLKEKFTQQGLINPEQAVLVPFQAWNYRELVLGEFEEADFVATYEEVIQAALSGNLIPPKGSRHGVAIKRGSNNEVHKAIPVACCQPQIEMALNQIFGIS
jgi:hypothetical protein